MPKRIVSRKRWGAAVGAEAHTDDYAYEFEFDARPWFEHASDDQIVALAAIEWGGDYAADEIAHFMETRAHEFADMFHYLRSSTVRQRKDAPGFEVHVNWRDAIAWISKNRPHLMDHPQVARWA